MQSANEDTLEHLTLLSQLIKAADGWPAEIGSLEYLPEVFGHWSLTVRQNGRRTRFAFDARDKVLSAERLPRKAGDFSAGSTALGDLPLPSGFTRASFEDVLEFLRKHAAS